MKNIHIALDMSNLSSGGSISILLRYMRYWQQCGFDMTVYYSRPIIREEIERSRLNVKMTEVCHGYPAWRTFLFRCFKLGKLIERDRADLVYCVNSMLLRCPVPQVVHMRNLQHFIEPSYLRQFKNGGLYEVVRDWICRYSVSHAACCVYVSNYLKNMAERWWKKSSSGRQFVIHNPVSDQHVKLSGQLRERNCFDKNLIVGIFNDYPHKDVPTFLRAFAEVAASQPERPWRAVILGGGQWQLHYGQLLNELNLNGRIEFPGYVPADRTEFYYTQAFCMLNTSRLEAFNNTPLESMTLGCPVVLSDCCSHGEVAGDAAMLVPPGDAGAFAAAIRKLSGDPELYQNMRMRGFRRVKRFLPQDSGEKFAELFLRTAGIE